MVVQRILVVSFFYLLAQMAGAGGLVALLLGISGRAGQNLEKASNSGRLLRWLTPIPCKIDW